MQTTSALYKQILANPNHKTEWKITVNGVDYGQAKICNTVAGGDGRPRITRQLFSGNSPEVGACVANRFACVLFEVSANIPRMATVKPFYRLILGSQQSEWIQKGEYFIDTRKPEKAPAVLALQCYDAMLKADGENGKPYAQLTAFATWPQPMSAVVTEIAAIMGVTVDARTVINTGAGYTVEYPNDYTMREVLGFIGAAHGGCWTMTDVGALRLLPITGGTDTLAVGWALTKLSDPPALTAWSGCDVYTGDETAFSAGDDTSRVLQCEDPWATQDTADDLLNVISGHSYQPFHADGVIMDLAAELGDVVTLGGSGGALSGSVTGPIFSMETVCDAGSRCVIAAPGEEEIDHEYPYASQVQRTLRRKVSLATPYYGVTISREHGIEITRTDGASRAVFNSDTFAMQALIDGVMQDRIWFDPSKGDYVFEGALGADAVFTESLYAEQGDIAELTVDSLSTSRRVRKYILGDQSDDNYIAIQDQYMRFVTGTVTSTTPVQATNRNNAPLYWQREPVSHDAYGYPYDADGQQIYATTTVTSWPVYTYTYSELVKAEFFFALENNVYVPMLVLGAGDTHGYTKGTLHKSPTGLDILFTASNGDTIGLKALSAGWLDLYGLRKPTALDFSGWDNGSFTETLDGNVVETFTVNFDANNRPVKITDSDGHETAVSW